MNYDLSPESITLRMSGRYTHLHSGAKEAVGDGCKRNRPLIYNLPRRSPESGRARVAG